MPIYKQTTEITKIDDVWANIDRDIVEVYFGDKNIFTVWSEYTGTLPITINANGDALLDYKIYGNTVQDGTPTPENPADVVGCGERFDITGLSEPLCGIGTYTDSLDLSTGILTRRIKKLVLTGEENWKFLSPGLAYLDTITDYSKVESNISKCSHFLTNDSAKTANDARKGITFYNTATAYYRMYLKDTTTFTTIDGLKSYLAQQYAAGTPVTVWYVLAEPKVSTIAVPPGLTGTIEGYLIQDGTPTPETPIYPIANGIKQSDGTYSIEYGYKLPILSNSTVTNIYLGEVKTTRRIKKLVLTGEEDYTWRRSATRNYSWYVFPDTIGTIAYTPFYCSHGETVTNVSDYGYGKVYCDNTCNLGIFDGSINSTAKLNNYFAQQYANGTPVTIWYVLAKPETGIVNEPLMKIGDYADTLSMEQAGVSIPTFVGETVIDYDGDPKPSQMYVKYRKQHS